MQARPCIFQPGNFTGWGSEGVNSPFPVKHILLECPITTELFQKNGYDLNAYNNVRDILYKSDVITNIVIVLWEN